MTDKRDYSFNKEDDDLLDNNKKSKKETSKNSSDRTNEFLIGHNGRCFDVRSQQQRNQSSLILSASEDGSSKLWLLDIQSKGGKCLNTFIHNKNAEVLRSCFLTTDDDVDQLVCTAGSDGNIIIWKKDETKNFQKLQTVKHDDKSQIYTCEALLQDCTSSSHRFITAADDSKLCLWDINQLETHLEWTFESVSNIGFGGERNPNNSAYLFDAKQKYSCYNTLAVAVSDGTIRSIDLREKITSNSIFSLNHKNFLSNQNSIGYATSINWSPSGNNLLISLGSGTIAIADVRKMEINSVLDGHSKTCFGANYVLSNESQLISWSSDHTLKKWDLTDNQLLSSITLPDYPIYSCVITHNNSIICAGGTGISKNSFIGNPLHIINSFL